jgi:protein JSN1
VQLFELSSAPVRKAMLERIAPHLAPIGYVPLRIHRMRTVLTCCLSNRTHKNGTWAVQKIIQCAEDEDEFALIEQSLAPYTPPLLLNDFGNYVVQGALRFAPPHSDFIFDAMVDRIWEIGAGRFGARSTRQTLENPDAPRLQVKRVASAIILNAIPLATSSNGALLVTWLLESSGLPNRFSLVAPRFGPHLSHLCTHKLASQSIMRVINQSEDDKAQQIMIDAFVDRETKVLEDVLGDQMHGVPCIQRLASSTFLTEERRETLFNRIREVIEALQLDGTPAYRRLIEDVGGVYTGPLSGLTPPYSPGGPHANGGRSSGRAGNRGPSPSQSPPFARRPQVPYPQSASNGQQQHHFVPPQVPYNAAPPYMNAMPYPQPTYGAPAGYVMYPQSMFSGQSGPSMMSLSPAYGPGSPHGSHRQDPYGQDPSSPHASPLVSHASMPYSPGAYPPIASPDPFQALRVSTGDGSVGFNPAFSPLASPPPPFFTASSFSTFAAQQDASRTAADGAF